MVSVVNDSCIKCKSCADVCPVDAFHEGETMLVVDPDTCIDCGVCIRNGLNSTQKNLKNGRMPTTNFQRFENFKPC